MPDPGDRQSASRGWTILRAGGKGTSGLEIPTKPAGVETGDGPVRFALGRSGEARLLLPLAANDDVRGLVGAPALDISISIFDEGGRSRKFLDLTCLVRELEAVFAEVSDEILSRVSSGVACLDAARSTIEEFRALLTARSNTNVSRERVAGLVGELLFLSRLIERSGDGWKAWRGPEGARHDFAMADIALEVKVTLKKGKSTISVTGLEQLSEPAGGQLFLQHFEFEAAANGVLSVSSLGQAVLARSSDPQRVGELLNSLGCRDIDDPDWNAIAFRLEAEALYEVRDGFPRIVASTLAGSSVPSGVSAVCYTVDLLAAADFRMNRDVAMRVEEKLVP